MALQISFTVPVVAHFGILFTLNEGEVENLGHRNHSVFALFVSEDEITDDRYNLYQEQGRA